VPLPTGTGNDYEENMNSINKFNRLKEQKELERRESILHVNERRQETEKRVKFQQLNELEKLLKIKDE